MPTFPTPNFLIILLVVAVIVTLFFAVVILALLKKENVKAAGWYGVFGFSLEANNEKHAASEKPHRTLGQKG